MKGIIRDIAKQMSIGEITGLTIVLIGFVLCVWHGFVFGLQHPELTNSQIILENWRWILGSTMTMVFGLVLFYLGEMGNG